MSDQDFVTFRNIGLNSSATGAQTSTVGEPSLATDGSGIFFSGNWYASRSTDNGSTWNHVSPFTSLPSAAGGFCCDQLVHCDPGRNMRLWLLQYVSGANGENIFRIAVNKDPSLDTGAWYWWDFSPSGTNSAWTNVWYDYPDMALTNDHLWITFNVFDANDRWVRAVVFKMPLDALASGTGLTYQYWATTSNGSLRLVQGAGDTMYWGSHNSSSQIKLSSWADNSSTINSWNINVNQWSGFGNVYSAPGPDGNNWLSRADPRITGGWVAGSTIGFMWTADRDNVKPLPYVRVVTIDAVTKDVVDQPDIWSQNSAFAYPAACPNGRDHVGVTMFYGGGANHPSHVVGIQDDFSNGAWDLRLAKTGTDGPAQQTWGDYLNCHTHSPNDRTWVASGYTLQGGSARANIEPRYVHFGRRRDQ